MSDELRDELADVYARWAEAPFEPADWQRQNGYQLADELLPVVRRYAARELRAAADDMRRLMPELDWADRLDERADAVEAGNSEEARPHGE